MYWSGGLFVTKKSILRSKAKEFFDKFCFALECFGETVTYTEEINAERRVGETQAGPGAIRIRFYYKDGHVEISIPLIEYGFESGNYRKAFLGERRCSCNMFFPREISEVDPRKIAREFHELSAEFIKVVGDIDKIQSEAAEKKNKIDKYAGERKAKIDADARERIRQLQATPA